MKKILLSIFVFSLMFMFGSFTHAQTTTFSRNLGVGSKGDDVKALQQLLMDKGYMSGTATNYFGNKTREALKKYQKDNGLEAIGRVGPRTLQKLNEERVGVTSDLGNSKKISDSQQNNVAVQSDADSCSSAFVSPVGGETWYVGSTHTILWNKDCVDVGSGPLDMKLMTDKAGPTMVYLIATSSIQESQQGYSWTIPSNIDLSLGGGFGGGYYFEMVGKAFDLRSRDFSILPAR